MCRTIRAARNDIAYGTFFALNVLVYKLPVVLVVGGLIALYWVIRRGVAAGIRDARSNPLAPDRRSKRTP